MKVASGDAEQSCQIRFCSITCQRNLGSELVQLLCIASAFSATAANCLRHQWHTVLIFLKSAVRVCSRLKAVHRLR